MIISYYWPVEGTSGNPLSLTMSSPNVIDILAHQEHGSQETRAYWKSRGKIILNRVYPFRPFKKEGDIFKHFEENIRGECGIIIDEILGNNLSKSKAMLLMNVLKKLRSTYPEKIIAVWSSAVWKDENVELLKAIRDVADVFLPEFYLAESQLKAKGFDVFTSRLETLEKQAPGILQKTLVGIGVYPKLDDREDVDFKDHILAQARFIRENKALGLRGIALYAPLYLKKDIQEALDIELQKFYAKDGE